MNFRPPVDVAGQTERPADAATGKPAVSSAATPPRPNAAAATAPSQPRPAPPAANGNPAAPAGGKVQAVAKPPAAAPGKPPAAGAQARAVAPAAGSPSAPARPSDAAGAQVALPGSMSGALAEEVLSLNPARLLRHKRNLFFLRIFIFVLLPTLITALYVYVYATPRFVSEVHIVYRDTNGSQATSSALSAIAGSVTSVDMVRVLDTFVQSNAALNAVDAKLDLRSKFSSPDIDWWNRLPKSASQQQFLNYYLKRVSTFQQTGGFLTVDVEAFSAKDAQDISAAIFAACDKMVAELYLKPRQDMVTFTKAEMTRRQNDLQSATDKVTDFREKHQDYDLSGTVTQLTSLVGGLQQQIAQSKAELASNLHYLGANAPTVIVLKTKIASLEAQVAAEQRRLASVPGASREDARQPYSQIMATYLDLTQAQEFAKTTYINAKAAYETAIFDLAKQPAYVVSFVPPTLPDRPTAPNGPRSILTTLIVTFILYAIVSLVLGTLREQSGI